MADRLPINFDIPAESAIASYNWNDVADGTGNVIFYLLQTNTGYLLHQQPLPSSGANYEKVYSYSGTGSVSLRGTNNYSLPAFTAPRTVKGKAYLELTTGMNGNAGAGRHGYITVNILKNSTNIGTVNTKDWGATDDVYHEVYEISLTETSFAIGDILTVQFKVYMQTRDSDSGVTAFFYGQDPINRDATRIIPSTNPDQFTTSKVHIPFKIEL